MNPNDRDYDLPSRDSSRFKGKKEYALYRKVRSTMGPNIEGIVVGAGYIKWPDGPPGTVTGDDEPMPVYIVKVGEAVGSNSDPEHSLVCKVLRIDRVEFLD